MDGVAAGLRTVFLLFKFKLRDIQISELIRCRVVAGLKHGLKHGLKPKVSKIKIWQWSHEITWKPPCVEVIFRTRSTN